MEDNLLSVFISDPRSYLSLPASEQHPFWVAVDELADAVDANFRRHAVEPVWLVPTPSFPANGSLLTVSGDVPCWAHRSRLLLPALDPRHAEILALARFYFTVARHALPDLEYELELGGTPLVWTASGGFDLLHRSE